MSNIVSDIWNAITERWGRKHPTTSKIETYNHLEDSSGLVIKVESILAVEGSAASTAAATVLSTLLDIDRQLLEKEDISKPLENLPVHSTIVMTESQLRDLFALRSHDFCGAVLVLSSDSFESLREKNKILKAGKGSHDVCDYHCTLPALLTKVAELRPLSKGNQKELQKRVGEYKAAHNGSFKEVFS